MTHRSAGRFALAALVAVAAVVLSSHSHAEVFETTDGRKLDGEFLSLTDGQVSIRYKGATVRLLLTDLVPASAYSVRRRALGETGTAAEHFALGEFCEGAGLLPQALAEYRTASQKDDAMGDECRRRMDAIDERVAGDLFARALAAYRAADFVTAEEGFNRVVREYPHTSRFAAAKALLVRIAEARASGAGKPTPSPESSASPGASAATPAPSPSASPSATLPVSESELDKRIAEAVERAAALAADAAQLLNEGKAEAAERHYPRARKALETAEAAAQKARDYLEFAIREGSQAVKRFAVGRLDTLTVLHVEILEQLTTLNLSVVSLNRATDAATKALKLDASNVRLQKLLDEIVRLRTEIASSKDKDKPKGP